VTCLSIINYFYCWIQQDSAIWTKKSVLHCRERQSYCTIHTLGCNSYDWANLL